MTVGNDYGKKGGKCCMQEKTKNNILLAVAWLLLLGAIIIGIAFVVTQGAGALELVRDSIFV